MIFKKIFGTKNERELRRLGATVQKINEQEPAVSGLTDEGLRAKTDEFRKRLKGGQSLDSLLVDAFAVVREAAKRTVGMRPFDVQLVGAVALHEGKIAEMATGEGKTLVATMPLYLNALTGHRAHLVTVNDYLAKRDRSWMGPIYELLGMKVGLIQHDMDPERRREAYLCDITYGTNNEFGFDYLRDNMVVQIVEKVQRPLHYAIVDEVDSILIDEARTPLIISGPAEESTEKYYTAAKIASRLSGRRITSKDETEAKAKEQDLSEGYDYVADEEKQTISLSEAGEIKAAEGWGVENLHEIDKIDERHLTIAALRAKEFFKKDVDYMLKDGRVIIVDEFTGRLMPGRRWSDGLHQSIEAKENVGIERENQTLATITFQNYFRMYENLAGMTGTADTEAAEFYEIYKLPVVVIPPNKKLRRTGHPDVIYKTSAEKFKAVADEIEHLHREGRPVLVGTISIEKSERLSSMLKHRGVPHNVLNAKYHEKEAEIVAGAGEPNAVTIATNMAGRGTDIVLGKGIAEKGGLHIIGTERHEARRIDNQLRGRAGRQGDPGSSRFYLSLEDDLMRIFASERVSSIMERLGWEKGVPLSSTEWADRLLSKTIENAQKRVEGHNFDIRKHLLEYDNVMNEQRGIIYEQRDLLLQGENVKEYTWEMAETLTEEKITLFAGEGRHPDDWDLEGLSVWLKDAFGITLSRAEVSGSTCGGELRDYILKRIQSIYGEREGEIGGEFHHLEQVVFLGIVDGNWKDHLYALDHLKEGIHMRAYGQRDPLIEYKREAFELFQEMTRRIRERCVQTIFRMSASRGAEVTLTVSRSWQGKEEFRSLEPFGSEHPAAKEGKEGEVAATTAGGRESEPAGETAGRAAPYKREGEKVGRNDPCPCGSGKKYKKCCGRK